MQLYSSYRGHSTLYADPGCLFGIHAHAQDLDPMLQLSWVNRATKGHYSNGDNGAANGKLVHSPLCAEWLCSRLCGSLGRKCMREMSSLNRSSSSKTRSLDIYRGRIMLETLLDSSLGDALVIQTRHSTILVASAGSSRYLVICPGILRLFTGNQTGGKPSMMDI